MTFLSDGELYANLTSAYPLIQNVRTKGGTEIDDPIQPCSVDLTIEAIFEPRDGPDSTDTNDAGKRHKAYDLPPGGSVKVSTKEIFCFDNRHGALLMAPARLTRCGIIIPDLAHVDPGFRGRAVTFTLINAARHKQPLEAGDVVATVLIFRLAQEARGLSERDESFANVTGWKRDLRHLSKDLFAAKERAAEEARRVMQVAGWKPKLFAWILPLVLGSLLGYGGYWFAVQSKLLALEERILDLKTKLDEKK